MWFVRTGTRVQGPFTEDQLRSLRKRGQFAPTHQISTDRVRWESAASLVQMLDGTMSQAHSGQTGSAGAQASHVSGAAEWYYLDSLRQQVGPVPEDEIVGRLASRQIAADGMVCKAGDSAWRQVAEVPEFAAYVRKSKKATWVAVTALIAAILAGGITAGIRQWGTGSGPSAANGKAAGDAGSSGTDSGSEAARLITSMDQRDKFREAVGLALMTCRLPNLDGTPGAKRELGTGSAFAITPDGYLLTNRHVAEYLTPEVVKKSFDKQWKNVIKELTDERNLVAQNYNANVQRLNRQDADAMTAKIKKNDELIDFFQRWNQVIQRKESDVSPKMVVFFDGVPFEAKLVHLSERFDMAILKIDRPRAGPFFRLCAENKIEQGEPVVILGYPGLALLARSEADQAIKDRNQEAGVDPEKRLLPQDFIHSETRGYVTRNIEDSSRTWSIEHDARTSGGNSGGPVVIKDGSVVGIHSAGVPGEGVKLNFAYSVAQFRKEIDAYVKSSSVWK